MPSEQAMAAEAEIQSLIREKSVKYTMEGKDPVAIGMEIIAENIPFAEIIDCHTQPRVVRKEITVSVKDPLGNPTSGPDLDIGDHGAYAAYWDMGRSLASPDETMT